MSIILNFKNVIKTVLKTVFGSRWFFESARFISRYNKRPNLLSVTYHDTPYSEMMNFRKQMSWYKSEFDDCNLEELKCFLDEGVWGKSNPGIIITFDDGLASNYTHASQILDEFGFTGWFMVPAGIIDLPIHDHLAFAHDGLIDFSLTPEQPRLFMSREQILDLRSRGHQIVCHSFSHARLSEDLPKNQMDIEVKLAKQSLEEVLGERVDCFAWVGGEERSYSRLAMRVIEDAGYKYTFATNCSPIYAKQSPMRLERYHVDVAFSLSEIRFAISYMYNILYRAKRGRVKNILRGK